MEKCIHCGADTELFIAWRPVCIKCETALKAETQAAIDKRIQEEKSLPEKGLPRGKK